MGSANFTPDIDVRVYSIAKLISEFCQGHALISRLGTLLCTYSIDTREADFVSVGDRGCTQHLDAQEFLEEWNGQLD